MEPITKKEIHYYITKEYRERHKDTETLTDYIKSLLKHLEEKYGFTPLHSELHRIFKRYIGTKEVPSKMAWSLVCQYITNNEDIYLVGIATYLKEREEDERTDD